MSSKCGLKMIFSSIIFIVIVNGYAKDISGVERGHNRLNEYISHYETLNYDHKHIRASHNRAKRSVTKEHIVNLKFQAHGRDFHLRLKRDLNTFSDRLEIYDNNNSPIDDISTDHIYEGHVIGEPNSYVFGSILHDGVFEGKIITERDAYYVEHAKRYFNNDKNNNNNKNHNTNNNNNSSSSTNNSTTKYSPQALRQSAARPQWEEKREEAASSQGASETVSANNNVTASSSKTTKTTKTPQSSNDDDGTPERTQTGFHSVIYKDSHVDDVYKDIREGHVAGCGITEEVSQWMENIQNSAVEELPEPMSKDDDAAKKLHKKRTATAQSVPGAERIRTTAHADGPISGVNEKDNGLAGITKKIKNNKNYKKSPTSATTRKTKAATFKLNSTSSPPGVAHPPKKYNSHNTHSDKVNHQHTNSDTSTRNVNNNSNNNQHNNGADDDFKFPHQKYSKEANFRATFVDPETGRQFEPDMDDDWHERVHERLRRASGSSNASGRREDNKNTCSLYKQTDPLIWRHIREGIADHDRGRKFEIDIKTREEITSLIAHHVTAVNFIYRNTKFDGRTEHRNIRFEVQRIKIDDDSACRTSYNGPHNAFCNEHMDVSNFLNLHSLEDHSLFCLAYVLAYSEASGLEIFELFPSIRMDLKFRNYYSI